MINFIKLRICDFQASKKQVVIQLENLSWVQEAIGNKLNFAIPLGVSIVILLYEDQAYKMEQDIPYFFQDAISIKFNRIANTFMKQVIKRINDIQNLNLQKSEIQQIQEEAKGDLRQACNIMQFNFRKENQRFSKKFKHENKQVKKPLKSISTEIEGQNGKDHKTALFNAIGKIIHQKFVDQTTKQLQLNNMITSLNNFVCDFRTFRQMLIENSIDHFNEIRDLSQCYEYYSMVETIESKLVKNYYGEYFKQQLDQNCSVILCMAVSLLNTNKLSLGFKPINKAQSRSIAKENRQAVKQAKRQYCGINFEKGGQFYLSGGAELMNLMPNLVSMYKNEELNRIQEGDANGNVADDPVE